MKKTKKIFLTAIVALLIVCFSASVFGCREVPETPVTPTEHTVTYVLNNGESNVVKTVEHGGLAVQPKDPVREGYRFVHWYATNQNVAYDFSTPVNDDLTLNALWETSVPVVEYTVLSWTENDFASYEFENGKPSKVVCGETVNFKITVSVYAKGQAEVFVGNTLLQSDANGNFTFVASGSEMLIHIEGLAKDDTPVTGNGTEANPYVLTTATNFKTFSDSVNSGSTKFAKAHVKLGADIDFGSEALEVIGGSIDCGFLGTFDGDGHTLSNFVLTGNGTLGGLFGYLLPGSVVQNVKIADAIYKFETTANYNFIGGGVAAYVMGADVINCQFDGTIFLDNAYYQGTVFFGGIAGFLQGYGTGISGTVSYCTANADLMFVGWYPAYATGGIVGSAVGTDPSSPANVFNCVFNGTIDDNSIISGGIVGYLQNYSSVAKCYSRGLVCAKAYGDDAIAAAGALIGIAESETALTNSYSEAEVDAQFSGTVSSNFQQGTLVALALKDGSQVQGLGVSVDSKQLFVSNSWLAQNGGITANGKQYSSFEDICDLLGWVSQEWSEENGIPQVVYGNYEPQFTVTLNFNGKTVDGESSVEVETGYYPLNWVFGGTGFNNFVADDGAISFGYFLDAECTRRLPSALLLTSQMTVYVGFADYSRIEGNFVALDANGEEVQLNFFNNGRMEMIYGGMVANYVYTYDGQRITVRDTYLAHLFYDDLYSDDVTDLYIDFDGSEQSKIAIYGNDYYPSDAPLFAYQKTLATGTWYDEQNNTYYFYADGTGLKVAANTAEQKFSYTANGNSVTVDSSLTGSEIFATISADGTEMTSDGMVFSATKFDRLRGVWESDYALGKSVSFDGKGQMTTDSATKGYTVGFENGKEILTFEDGTSGKINENGLLEITLDGVLYTMGREGSFIGTWTDTWLNYAFVLAGIGVDGIGYGADSYGLNFTYVARKDVEDTLNVSLYYRTQLYGFGNVKTVLDESTSLPYNMLLMAIFTPESGMIVDDYNMGYCDAFWGDWTSSDGWLFQFNGFGEYTVDINLSDGTSWKMKGEVTVTENGATQTVDYSYNRSTQKATFALNSKTYTATIGENGIIVVDSDGTTRNCFAYDGLQEFDLYSQGEVSYTLHFNGLSKANCGVAQLNGEEFAYTVAEGVITLYQNRTAAYTLSQNGNYLEMKNASDQTVAAQFGRYFAMQNRTFVLEDNTLSFATLDYNGNGVGYFNDKQLSLVWVSEKTVEAHLEDEFLFFARLYDQNNVVLYDEEGEVIGCFSVLDGWQGTYTSQKGNVITLNGAGLNVGYYPQATITINGKITEAYYKIVDENTIELYVLDENDVETTLFTVHKTLQNGAEEYLRNDDATAIFVVAVL